MITIFPLDLPMSLSPLHDVVFFDIRERGLKGITSNFIGGFAFSYALNGFSPRVQKELYPQKFESTISLVIQAQKTVYHV